MLQGNGSELEMSQQQSLPTETHGERFSPKKIFVTESRVFTESYRFRSQRGTVQQCEVITSDFHRSSESEFQTRGYFFLQRCETNQQRYGGTHQPYKNQKEQNPFRPSGPTGQPGRDRRDRLGSTFGMGERACPGRFFFQLNPPASGPRASYAASACAREDAEYFVPRPAAF